MSVFEGFDFDPLLDDDFSDSDTDFQIFEDESSEAEKVIPQEKEAVSEKKETVRRRTSADFEPDMDILLLTAQSSMIIEGLKLILKHDFRSVNLTVFSEAVQGIELYMKILERNPLNYKKLSGMLQTDMDCIEVEKITFNLFQNSTGEFPESESQKMMAFELVREKLRTGYNKSLISLAIIKIKNFFLLSGGLDIAKMDVFIKKNPVKCREEFIRLSRYIQVARDLMKSGDYEINKGMKGREVNVFLIRSTEILCYYFTGTGETDYVSFYKRLHDNFKRYYIVR